MRPLAQGRAQRRGSLSWEGENGAAIEAAAQGRAQAAGTDEGGGHQDSDAKADWGGRDGGHDSEGNSRQRPGGQCQQPEGGSSLEVLRRGQTEDCQGSQAQGSPSWLQCSPHSCPCALSSWRPSAVDRLASGLGSATGARTSPTCENALRPAGAARRLQQRSPATCQAGRLMHEQEHSRAAQQFALRPEALADHLQQQLQDAAVAGKRAASGCSASGQARACWSTCWPHAALRERPCQANGPHCHGAVALTPKRHTQRGLSRADVVEALHDHEPWEAEAAVKLDPIQEPSRCADYQLQLFATERQRTQPAQACRRVCKGPSRRERPVPRR